MMLQSIWDKIEQNIEITPQDAIALLQIDTTTADFYRLLAASNAYSRRTFGKKGYVFAQIGLNTNPCTGNCKFCSIAKDYFAGGADFRKSDAEIRALLEAIDTTSVTTVFLMTTADFGQREFLRIGAMARKILPAHVKMVANVGDFDLPYAKKLREVGFSGMYHIVRLREGIDTDLPVATREASIAALREAGLSLYYCIEPIGVEHTAEEILVELERAKAQQVDVMAVMGRVPVAGTAFANVPEISEQALAKVVAVANLFVQPKLSMNIHEPKPMAMLAGVNQLYAEIGVNPRDNDVETEKNRGYSVQKVQKMLIDAGFDQFS